MQIGEPLDAYLSRTTADEPLGSAVKTVIEAIAEVAAEVADIVALGDLAGQLAQACGPGAGGDVQKALDLDAHRLFRDALAPCPVAALASEEADALDILDPAAPLCLAIDPIDGSGNIDLNMPVGTIFSLAPTPAGLSAGAPFRWPHGRSQCAAGFITYGPQTTLVLSTGGSVDALTLDRPSRTFRLTRPGLRLPADHPDEFAINVSNHRHWTRPIRRFVDDCLAGVTGPHGHDFNMRWHGAMVAEAYRILMRGGVYLYPSDARPGYEAGRLRLIYEAFPIAFLMERAGGAASDGYGPILDVVPESLHGRVPLIFGSKAVVDRLEALHRRPEIWPQATAPLFAHRSLFRA